jgi:hypothetical protein
MRHKLLPVAMLALCPWAMPAAAAERIYCAASDAVANISLESGFSRNDEERLNHFRGIAGVKGDAVPAEFRRFEINSDMLRQYWTDDRDLRFSLQLFSSPRTPAYRITLSILTSRKSNSAPRFEGSYRLAVQKLNPGSRIKGEILLDQEAPIFCAIKR